jgi:hypothetical protein
MSAQTSRVWACNLFVSEICVLRNESIKIHGGDLSRAATVLTYKNGATEKAVQRRD